MKIPQMSEERCIMCGEIIPEGRMVCLVCEHKIMQANPIEFFEPTPDKIIVFKFKTEPLNLDQIIQICKNIQNAFPNNTVVAIPDNSCFEVFTKDTLIEILQNIIKQLED